MKFLRILVITTMLNIPCAHAMEESSITTAQVVGTVIRTAGMGVGLAVASDGADRIFSSHKGLVPNVSNDYYPINRLGNIVFGGAEVAAGYVVMFASFVSNPTASWGK